MFKWNSCNIGNRRRLHAGKWNSKIKRDLAVSWSLIEILPSYKVRLQVTCGMVIKADAITKRSLIKQTKLQLTLYLHISVLTLNKFKPGIQAYISLQEWQTTVTRGVYINSFSDSLHGRIGQKKITMLKLFDGIT